MSHTRQQHTLKNFREFSHWWWEIIERNDPGTFWGICQHLHNRNSTIFWLICELNLFSDIFSSTRWFYFWNSKKKVDKFTYITIHHQSIRTPSLSTESQSFNPHADFEIFNVIIWETKQRRKNKTENIKIRPNVQRQFECVFVVHMFGFRWKLIVIVWKSIWH